jgi:hypothetical protein
MLQPSQQGILCDLLTQVLYGLWKGLLRQDHEPMHTKDGLGLRTRQSSAVAATVLLDLLLFSGMVCWQQNRYRGDIPYARGFMPRMSSAQQWAVDPTCGMCCVQLITVGFSHGHEHTAVIIIGCLQGLFSGSNDRAGAQTDDQSLTVQ